MFISLNDQVSVDAGTVPLLVHIGKNRGLILISNNQGKPSHRVSVEILGSINAPTLGLSCAVKNSLKPRLRFDFFSNKVLIIVLPHTLPNH